MEKHVKSSHISEGVQGFSDADVVTSITRTEVRTKEQTKKLINSLTHFQRVGMSAFTVYSFSPFLIATHQSP